MIKKTLNRTYKISALLGYLIIAASILFPFKYMQSLEDNTSRVFEKIITSDLEAKGLENELLHLEKVLSKADKLETLKDVLVVDDIDYSQYEIERLRKERDNINLYLREKELNKEKYISAKNHLLNEVKVLFVVSSLCMLLGTLMAAFGTIAWYFQLELFEDRRKTERKTVKNKQEG